MGLSIHYNGKLKDIALLPQLVEEVQDVCNVLNWKYQLDNNDDIKGIWFSPPECEPFAFTFYPSGELVNKLYLRCNIEPANTVSVKTQFAGVDVHMAATKLLRHLARRYFSVFNVSDEGRYWETDDEEILRKQFGLYNALLNAVAETLKDFNAEKGDRPERLADRLEAFLNERWNGKPLI